KRCCHICRIPAGVPAGRKPELMLSGSPLAAFAHLLRNPRVLEACNAQIMTRRNHKFARSHVESRVSPGDHVPPTFLPGGRNVKAQSNVWRSWSATDEQRDRLPE